MATLTEEQRFQLKQCGEGLLWFLDPDTNKEYVLLEANAFQRLQFLLGDIDPREMYPLLNRAMHDEGWDEPHMDEYNPYS